MPVLPRLRRLFAAGHQATARKPGPGEIGERLRQYGERMREEAMEEMEKREERQKAVAARMQETMEGMKEVFMRRYGIDLDLAHNIEILSARGQRGLEEIEKVLHMHNIAYSPEAVRKIIDAVQEFKKWQQNPKVWPKWMMQ